MQPFKYIEVVNRTATQNKLNPELVKSISDFVFKSTKEEMFKFNNLRIHIQHFVTWYYGRDRLKKYKNNIKRVITGEYKIPYWLSKYTEEGRQAVHDKVVNLLDVYEKFVEEKRTVKTAFKQSKRELNTEI